ncbi:MAG: LytTR family DNA-binding domain-containing protein, partial [Anaerovoracaceae bacterium]
MFYIVICDDDKGICAQVEDILLDYSRKLCLKLEIDVVYSGESILTLLKEDSPIDLIFLDIEMGGINGVEVGTYIRTVLRNHRIEIVYVSGRNDYDRQLFDVQPLHFIAKPISASAVIADLKLAMERANRTIDQFVYKKGSEERGFPVHEIIYFE